MKRAPPSHRTLFLALLSCSCLLSPRCLHLLAVLGALPLAEGVVTTVPKVFPAVQLVFNAHVQIRYLFYPTAWSEMTPAEVGRAIIAPALDQKQINNLDEARLDAMAVDPGRYGLMLGFGNDIYFKQGVFVSPRVMLATPVMAPVTDTNMLFWADLSLAVGVAL